MWGALGNLSHGKRIVAAFSLDVRLITALQVLQVHLFYPSHSRGVRIYLFIYFIFMNQALSAEYAADSKKTTVPRTTAAPTGSRAPWLSVERPSSPTTQPLRRPRANGRRPHRARSRGVGHVLREEQSPKVGVRRPHTQRLQHCRGAGRGLTRHKHETKSVAPSSRAATSSAGSAPAATRTPNGRARTC